MTPVSGNTVGEAAGQAAGDDLFARAQALEDDGRHDEAFEAFAHANAVRRASLDPAGFARHSAELLENIKWLFAENLFQRRHVGHSSRAPVFIVGMMRSGSTLVEQVLDSHSKVTGLGEIFTFEEVAKLRYPFPAPPPSPRHFVELGEDYLKAVQAIGWPNTPRFVDKQLANFWYVGAIHLTFPNATILHCVRDPIDTCLSCFRANFNAAAPIFFDLADIGAHYVRYRRMMDHWEDVLPGRLVTVDHEAMIADFPDQAQRLIEACGLRWEKGCLRFYENQRRVYTASFEQVRRPIFNESVGRWRRYERHLGPLKESLGPYAAGAATCGG